MTRPRGALTAAILALSFLPSIAAAQAGPWGNLSTWEGHYPTDTLPGAPGGFLALPALHQTLTAILTPSDRHRLTTYAEASQIEPVGQYEVLSLCQPHDCPAENATIILDETSPRLWVAFYAHIGAVVSVRWYGTDDYEHLPAAVLDEVLYGHEPRP